MVRGLTIPSSRGNVGVLWSSVTSPHSPPYLKLMTTEPVLGIQTLATISAAPNQCSLPQMRPCGQSEWTRVGNGKEKGQNTSCIGMCQRALELADSGGFRGKICRAHIDSFSPPPHPISQKIRDAAATVVVDEKREDGLMRLDILRNI